MPLSPSTFSNPSRMLSCSACVNSISISVHRLGIFLFSARDVSVCESVRNIVDVTGESIYAFCYECTYFC